MNKDQSVIPEGVYCYSHTGEVNEWGFPKLKVCPYWGKDNSKPQQGNGFCTFIEKNDWSEDGTSFLWDQVKECGINEGLDEILNQIKSKRP